MGLMLLVLTVVVACCCSAVCGLGVHGNVLRERCWLGGQLVGAVERQASASAISARRQRLQQGLRSERLGKSAAAARVPAFLCPNQIGLDALIWL